MDRELKQTSQSIIRALKSGNVPWKGVDKIIVGRDIEINQIKNDLKYVTNGGSVTKFFQGAYGSGKTLMASMIRELVWKENFVVAALDLGRQAPFNKFEIVYSKIMQSLRTREFPNVPAFDLILQEWLITLENTIERKEGLDRLNPTDKAQLTKIVTNEIERRLISISAIQPTFAAMIRSYYQYRIEGNFEMSESAIAILRGDRNISAKKKRLLNYKGTISREDTFIYLRAFVQLLLEIGYSGLVIIFDEAELIRGLANRRLRAVAHENVRNIYDSCNMGLFKNMLFVFCGTPDWFEDNEKGIPGYQALNDRIRTRVSQTTYRDLRSPIISLSGLSKDYLKELANRIITIHSNAYEWDARKYLSEKIITKSIDILSYRFGAEQPVNPRIFAKTLVDMLDLTNQYPEINLEREFDLVQESSRITEVFEGTEATITTIQ